MPDGRGKRSRFPETRWLLEREAARCLTYGWLPDEVGRALRDELTGR